MSNLAFRLGRFLLPERIRSNLLLFPLSRQVELESHYSQQDTYPSFLIPEKTLSPRFHLPKTEFSTPHGGKGGTRFSIWQSWPILL